MLWFLCLILDLIFSPIDCDYMAMQFQRAALKCTDLCFAFNE